MRDWISNLGWWLAVIFGPLGIFIPFCQKIPTANISPNLPWLITGLTWVQENVWILTPSAGVIAGLGAWAVKFLGEPWMRHLARELLNQFRDDIFFDKAKEPVHHHRVTLFKCSRICFTRGFNRLTMRWLKWPKWPRSPLWRGRIWARMYLRSHHTTQTSKPTFSLPDNGKGEGVVGRAWACRSMVYICDLPQICSNSSDEDCKSYAEKTYMSFEEVRYRTRNNEKEFARSYCAFPIERKGKIWGLIVIDSQAPKLMSEEEIQKRFQSIGSCLTKLAERL